MDQIPLLTIKVTKPGVELMLNALAQLPYAQTAGLIKEVEAQANMQLEMMQRAAEKQAAEAEQASEEEVK
jgi:hypothetical protein